MNFRETLGSNKEQNSGYLVIGAYRGSRLAAAQRGLEAELHSFELTLWAEASENAGMFRR